LRNYLLAYLATDIVSPRKYPTATALRVDSSVEHASGSTWRTIIIWLAHL